MLSDEDLKILRELLPYSEPGDIEERERRLLEYEERKRESEAASTAPAR